jgi:hypothetical protein
VRLPIEAWIEANGLPREAAISFEESIICYKAGANRAALLFAYASWGLTLRYRLLAATPPNGFSDSHWKGIVEKLRSEDTWDVQVFQCTQQTSPAPVFDVSEDAREQIKYWKNRRNDCAHFKLNRIEGSHVESFWSFLQSAFGRFVPIGSTESLINQIGRHFDIDHTAPGTPVVHLVHLISSSVDPARLVEFFHSVAELLCFKIANKRLYSAVALAFYEGVFMHGSQDAIARLTEFVHSDNDLLWGVVCYNPVRAVLLVGLPDTVRQFWRRRLFREGSPGGLHVYATFLRLNLIPSAELDESIGYAVPGHSSGVPDQEDLRTLQRTNFFSRFGAYAFHEDRIQDFAWANGNAELICWYLETFEIVDKTALAISDAFARSHYATVLRERVAALMQVNSKKKGEFCSALGRVGRDWPARLDVNVENKP